MLDNRRGNPTSLARSGRSNDQQRRPQHIQIYPEVAADLEVAPMIGHDLTQPDLAGQEIVPSEPTTRQIALVRRMYKGCTAVLLNGPSKPFQAGRISGGLPN